MADLGTALVSDWNLVWLELSSRSSRWRLNVIHFSNLLIFFKINMSILRNMIGECGKLFVLQNNVYASDTVSKDSVNGPKWPILTNADENVLLDFDMHVFVFINFSKINISLSKQYG